MCFRGKSWGRGSRKAKALGPLGKQSGVAVWADWVQCGQRVDYVGPLTAQCRSCGVLPSSVQQEMAPCLSSAEDVLMTLKSFLAALWRGDCSEATAVARRPV